MKIDFKKKEDTGFQPVQITDEQAKAFERQLETYKLSAIRDHGIEYYGRPIPGSADMVGNEIIGAAHWSVVKYCLENKIIGRREGSWYVVAEVLENRPGGRCETAAYDRFIALWKALYDLRSRRLYIQDKNDESFGGGRIERIKMAMQRTRDAIMANVL